MKHWTPEEDAELKRLYATEASAREIAVAMGRSKASIKNRVNTQGLKKPNGITNSGRFLPGQKSWNKGKKGLVMGGRSAETQFKPGQRPHTWQPVGHERINADGYHERKMTDTGVTRHDYVPLHLMLWREHHGEVPDGCVVVFRNKDKDDIRIENLECITRRELMARNTVHNYPPELRQVIRLKAVVSRKINDLTREEQS
ncbi:MAG: HNH endonuclease [Pseudomonadota bacterium]